jgi:hypothetical protein
VESSAGSTAQRPRPLTSPRPDWGARRLPREHHDLVGAPPRELRLESSAAAAVGPREIRGSSTSTGICSSSATGIRGSWTAMTSIRCLGRHARTRPSSPCCIHRCSMDADVVLPIEPAPNRSMDAGGRDWRQGEMMDQPRDKVWFVFHFGPFLF